MWKTNRFGSSHKVQTPYHGNKRCHKVLQREEQKVLDRRKMKWTKRERDRRRDRGGKCRERADANGKE